MMSVKAEKALIVVLGTVAIAVTWFVLPKKKENAIWIVRAPVAMASVKKMRITIIVQLTATRFEHHSLRGVHNSFKIDYFYGTHDKTQRFCHNYYFR